MKHKKYIWGLLFGILITICVYCFFYLKVDRTPEFRAQAKIGQPIVQAIEAYYKQTGSYPDSLTNLAPKYLGTLPDVADPEHGNVSGWDYHIVAGDKSYTYSLRFYMGRGGVEYMSPNWIGNDEGRRTILFKNE